MIKLQDQFSVYQVKAGREYRPYRLLSKDIHCLFDNEIRESVVCFFSGLSTSQRR